MTQIKETIRHEKKNISASGVVCFNIPPYKTIDDIILHFENDGTDATMLDVLSSIGNINLTIGADQIINCDLEDIVDVAKTMGVKIYQNDSGVVSLNIGKQVFDDVANQNFFAFGCAEGKGIQLQITAKSTVTKVTHIEAITVRRSVDTPLGSVIKLIEYPQAFNGTGEHKVNTLPKDAADGYIGVLVKASGGTITHGECSINGNKLIHKITASVNKHILATREFNQLAGYFAYFFADGGVCSAVPMAGVTDLDFAQTFSVAPTGGNYKMLALTIKNMPSGMLAEIAK